MEVRCLVVLIGTNFVVQDGSKQTVCTFWILLGKGGFGGGRGFTWSQTRFQTVT
jgi:hypothetical protein